jgi:carboxylesterase
VSVSPTAAPFHADADPSKTGGKSIGVLLSHGFTGSPFSMIPWGRYLAEQGYAVSVPRLPGHGTTWQEMNRTRWEDWYGEVVRAFDDLMADNDIVVVGGLSMGGSLALRLAADRGTQVAGLMLVNPGLDTERKDVLALPLLKHIVASMPGLTNDILKSGVDEHGYSRTPLKAADSMFQAWKVLRADLSQVTAPIVFFRSTVDHVVDRSSDRALRAGVSSTDLTEIALENSYHVATIDNDAPLIFSESDKFIRRVTGI